MAMTFDATLKDMGRESPQGFLAAFDRPPAAPVRLLNVEMEFSYYVFPHDPVVPPPGAEDLGQAVL
jgi:hypothetical protein